MGQTFFDIDMITGIDPDAIIVVPTPPLHCDHRRDRALDYISANDMNDYGFSRLQIAEKECQPSRIPIEWRDISQLAVLDVHTDCVAAALVTVHPVIPDTVLDKFEVSIEKRFSIDGGQRRNV